MEIEVECLTEDPWECQVTVSYEDNLLGEYVVGMSGDEYRRFGGDREPTEVIQATLRFLLDHEEPEEILERFNIGDVERYFPEFPDQIQNYP